MYGVKKIGIFGSFVKGAQKIGSDLDILIEMIDLGLTSVQIAAAIEKSFLMEVEHEA